MACTVNQTFTCDLMNFVSASCVLYSWQSVACPDCIKLRLTIARYICKMVLFRAQYHSLARSRLFSCPQMKARQNSTQLPFEEGKQVRFRRKLGYRLSIFCLPGSFNFIFPSNLEKWSAVLHNSGSDIYTWRNELCLVPFRGWTSVRHSVASRALPFGRAL